MPPEGPALDALLGELSAAIALDPGPVLTVPLPGWSTDDAAAVVDDLAARAGPSVSRSLFVGDGVAFIGVGEALGLRDPDGIAATVAAAPGRRLVVTLPFAAAWPSSMSSSSWARHRARVATAPRLWLHHRDGVGTIGVDLGVHLDQDSGAARREARALIDRWRRATPSSAPGASSLAVTTSSSVPDEAGHRRAVATALAAFAAGRLEKVVLARRRRLRLAGGHPDLPLALWRAARSSSPVEVRYLVDLGGDALVGVTPERLCRRRGRTLEVDVLAGTAPLDDSGLLHDDKERREHAAVRDFIVAALQPVAARIDAPVVPGVRRLRQLQHLHTPVRAELVDAAPVFLRLHPTPAVAGSPRDVATGLIASLEGFDRGLYAGAIGVVEADGEDLRVALRCAHVVVDGDSAHDSANVGGAAVDLYVGSGLVPGSDARREWLELDRKEATMATALATLVDGAGEGRGHGAA